MSQFTQKVLLELGVIKASTTLIVPGQEHFHIQARRPATQPREKTGAKWLGVAIVITAGVYQLTPWKDWCLRRCRSPIGVLMYYTGFKGQSRDVRVGLHHGATCVDGVGLMILLIAVGVMNVAVMAALAAVIFVEKL